MQGPLSGGKPRCLVNLPKLKTTIVRTLHYTASAYFVCVEVGLYDLLRVLTLTNLPIRIRLPA